MRRGLLSSALAACLAVGTTVRADTPPSAWDVALDPAQATRWKVHVSAQRLLQSPSDDAKLRAEAARAMLEDVDAANSPDVRLRFDLGEAYAQLEMQGRVVAVLAPALAMAPDHPASTAALGRLAFAYAKLGSSREELDVWRRYVPRLDDRARALDMMNMGEAEMRLGYLDDALGTFREVLELCGELPNFPGVIENYALTLWDLAVALDRSGDARGALDTAGKAMALVWQRGHGPGRSVITGSAAIEDTEAVFFVPEWEREWYLALETSQEARASSDPAEAAAHWKEAEGHRAAYVDGASRAPAPDPWLDVAKRRLDQVRAESARARKAVEEGASRGARR